MCSIDWVETLPQCEHFTKGSIKHDEAAEKRAQATTGQGKKWNLKTGKLIGK